MEAKLLIDQKDNFRANFGEVLRSSAIFYYRQGGGFGTTISFMNYWKAKRGLTVALVASVRDMAGKLVRRERLRFEEGAVINYAPRIAGQETFEGSVEIEVFAIENMVIPYSAMTAVYQSPAGVSMVHSYARAYSRHEIEDGRCICIGEEACWTLRDTSSVRSFGVFHNGPAAVPDQAASLRVAASDGRRTQVEIALGSLAPYQSVKIVPGDHVRGLADFLRGEPGSASVSFRLGEGFTRMLVGNETVDGRDFQATHSNFDYSRHRTDLLEDPDAVGYMYVPSCGLDDKTVVVYPDADPGDYELSSEQQSVSFSAGQRVSYPYEQGVLRFAKRNGKLPSRIVTAIGGSRRTGQALPFECSLGVLTLAQPPKHMWWGLCAAQPDLRSTLIMHDAPAIYGGIPADASIAVALHSPRSQETLECTLGAGDMTALDRGIPLVELFPEAETHLGGGFGYYTMKSTYPGLTCYSTLQNEHGSISLEHGF